MEILQWLLCIAMLVKVLTSRTEAGSLQALYFFGSSYLDVGTNNYLNYTSESNSLPFGETYFGYPTGRHSNGLILSDFIELKLGFPFLPPYLRPDANFSLGANFASAGSGILDSTEISSGPVISFFRQTQQFWSLVRARDAGRLSDSLVVVNAGANDLLQYGLISPSLSMPLDQLVPLLLSRYERFLKVLYDAGARNFLIVGLTTLGNQPTMRPWFKQELLDQLNTMVQQYNAGLNKIALELTRRLTGAELMFFDPYNLFVDMINNGPKYGFEDTRDTCYVPSQFLCEDPSKYLYWNDHPTQQAFQYMAEAIWSGDSSLIKPINLQSFVQRRGTRSFSS